jgi:hypothetical protein
MAGRLGGSQGEIVMKKQMNRVRKPIQLWRDTVRVLSADALDRAVGGYVWRVGGGSSNMEQISCGGSCDCPV